jgi:hypothetical protein
MTTTSPSPPNLPVRNDGNAEPRVRASRINFAASVTALLHRRYTGNSKSFAPASNFQFGTLRASRITLDRKGPRGPININLPWRTRVRHNHN